MKISDFASIFKLRGKMARGSWHFHTPCVFVILPLDRSTLASLGVRTNVGNLSWPTCRFLIAVTVLYSCGKIWCFDERAEPELLTPQWHNRVSRQTWTLRGKPKHPERLLAISPPLPLWQNVGFRRTCRLCVADIRMASLHIMTNLSTQRQTKAPIATTHRQSSTTTFWFHSGQPDARVVPYPQCPGC